MLSESRPVPIATPQRLPFDEVPPRVRSAAVVPVVDEVPDLLAAAERVLTACAEVEREHGERCLAMAPALDPALTPPLAVAGPELPRPLADRVALRALRRLALALHPRVPGDAEGWWAPGGRDRVIEYRAVVVDARDLPLLAEAAAALMHPRRAHEGALARVRERLNAGQGEPPADRHPEALGCLLATILPVDDAETVVVHRVACEARAGSAGAVVLDERALTAHRAVGRRILRRL